MRVGPGPAFQTALPAADVPQRWSDAQRVGVYQCVLGASGGTPGNVQSNREFESLWLRFVASVAQFSRQDSPSVRTPGPSFDSVRAAGRDLAAAALPRIDAWFRRDLWNVVDRVATTELGGATNGARHRTLAQAGGAVLEWLSTHRDAVDPTHGNEHSLADAVEQWIAVAGTADDRVEAAAQPGAAAARVTEWSRALFSALDLDGVAAGAARGTAPRLAALFDGAPGTGKTLAAHWLACSLGLDVLRLDVSQVASKYIGETEKNLDRVLADAGRAGAVLLFDEADALFARRTGVRDAHDRYANLELDDLLQRIARYEGVAILATNASTQIDADLLKRVKATVVTFPLPPG